MARKVLVTGAAGFIGAFLVKRLLEETSDVIIGYDNLNNYYDLASSMRVCACLPKLT